MPKEAAPWFRASSNTWVIRQRGRLTTLAKGKANRAEAVAKWRVMRDATAPSGLTIGSLADSFLAWCEANREALTTLWYRRHVGAFTARFGRQTPPEAVSTDAVTSWVDGTPWSRATRCGLLVAVRRLYGWGCRRKGLTVHPLRGVELPEIRRRERIPTTAEVAELLGAARGNVKDLLAFVAETGCRVSEAQRLLVRHVDLAAGTCVMPGKTSRKTRRPRVIYLSVVASNVVRRRMQGRPADGRVFTTATGHHWADSTLKGAMDRLRLRLGLGSHVTAGGIRHWWITERLRAGVPIAHVAELAGHLSTTMIARHYGHLSDHGQDLRRALERKAS